MRKTKKKIYRKPQDFYTEKDLKDDEIKTRINLTVNDFNAQGHLTNPPAPCVVTTIDPQYIKDAGQQKLTKKFRMKTDILILREITRNKFTIYSTEQRYLEKQRYAEQQEKIYNELLEFNKLTEKSLDQMKADAFKEMMKTFEKLKLIEAKRPPLEKELKEINDNYQRVLEDAQNIYRQFLYALKKISYFDHIENEETLAAEGNSNDNASEKLKLIKPLEITNMEISEKHIVGKKQIADIQLYMEQVVRPYLAKKHYLNAEIWLNGYENIRHKIFHFNRRSMNLGLLNLAVKIIYDKFEANYRKRIEPTRFLKEPKLIQERANTLKEHTTTAVENYEKEYKKDKQTLKLNAIIPVMLKSIEAALVADNSKNNVESKTLHKQMSHKIESDSKDTQDDTLMQVRRIQTHLLELLNKFDALPPEMVQKAEKVVRRRMILNKEKSKRALQKQNRMENWLEHFKKHAAQNMQ